MDADTPRRREAYDWLELTTRLTTLEGRISGIGATTDAAMERIDQLADAHSSHAPSGHVVVNEVMARIQAVSDDVARVDGRTYAANRRLDDLERSHTTGLDDEEIRRRLESLEETTIRHGDGSTHGDHPFLSGLLRQLEKRVGQVERWSEGTMGYSQRLATLEANVADHEQRLDRRWGGVRGWIERDPLPIPETWEVDTRLANALSASGVLDPAARSRTLGSLATGLIEACAKAGLEIRRTGS